jgi:hypothetical protein
MRRRNRAFSRPGRRSRSRLQRPSPSLYGKRSGTGLAPAFQAVAEGDEVVLADFVDAAGRDVDQVEGP